MTEGSEWYRKYRPSDLDEVLGNSTEIRRLEALLQGGKLPHAVLLTGSKGTGKTTVARILANRLGALPADITEVNCANQRGIDDIRGIKGDTYIRAWGKCRVWIMDECFPSWTMIRSEGGNKPICQMRVGDKVQNLAGWGTVQHVFKNTVPLNRIVKVYFDNGSTLTTTKEHLLFTTKGWKKAGEAVGACVVSMGSGMMADVIESRQEHTYEDIGLCILPQHVRSEAQREAPQLLRQVLRPEVATGGDGEWTDRNSQVLGVQEGVHGGKVQPQSLLQQNVSCEQQDQAARNQGEAAQQGNGSEDIGGAQGKVCSLGGNDLHVSQPRAEEVDGGKEPGYEGGEGDAARLAGSSWREWPVDGPANGFVGRVAEGGSGVEGGAFHQNGEDAKGRVPAQVHGGYGEYQKETGSGGGRPWAQTEQEYLARCEEDGTAVLARVDRVEVYKQGRNDSSFVGTVSDQDRLNGFVVFYDMEVSGHPSYFAEGWPVHNCQMMTPEAQTAMLKMLEDPADSVYYFLATTDPNKIKPTVRDRCTPVPMSPLSDSIMGTLLTTVATAEGYEGVPQDIGDRIIEVAEGSARMALVLLEKALQIEDEEEALAAIGMSSEKGEIFELCKALMGGNYKSCAAVLKKCEDEDPEGVRRMVLGYFRKIMLNNPSAKTFKILKAFEMNYYDSGKAGLVISCYEACS